MADLPDIKTKYKKNEKIDVWAGRLRSIKTQLPFSYYDLNFCGKDQFGKQFHTPSVGEELMRE